MSAGALPQLALRRTLGVYPTGVCVVTCLDVGGRRCGVTISSFNSVSLDPPLVLWSLSNAAPSLPAFTAAERFAVNILEADQRELSTRFARPADDKFAGVACTEGMGGVPLIRGAAAWLECSRYASYPGGDHTILLGEITRHAVGSARPLVFHGGEYRDIEQVMLTELAPFGVPA